MDSRQCREGSHPSAAKQYICIIYGNNYVQYTTIQCMYITQYSMYNNALEYLKKMENVHDTVQYTYVYAAINVL